MSLSYRYKYRHRDRRLPIRKGITVLVAEPFAHVLRSLHRSKRCDHCFKRGKLLRCSGCQYVYYCDRTCQRNAWLLHKIECPNLESIRPKTVPDMARLMAHVIIKLSQGGGDEVGYYSETGYRKFKDLMSHYENIKEDRKRMEQFTALYHVLNDYLKNVPLPDYKELLSIYGKICINCFMMCDMAMENIGVGIYLGPSIMDHSCNPNLIYSFDGTTMIVRTIENIPCLDWSVMRISYIDLLKTKRERRAELQSSYYFLCTCKRCETPEPTAEAAACPNKSCTYPCSANAYSCGGCNTKFPEDFHETFDNVSNFTELQLQKMDAFSYLDICRVCLEKQKDVLHPLNIQHLQTLQAAFDSSTALDHFEEAIYYGNELIKGCLWYYGEIHSWTGLMYLMLGKSHLLLKNVEEASIALGKALMILKTTYGEHHSAMQKDLKTCLVETFMIDSGWK